MTLKIARARSPFLDRDVFQLRETSGAVLRFISLDLLQKYFLHSHGKRGMENTKPLPFSRLLQEVYFL